MAKNKLQLKGELKGSEGGQIGSVVPLSFLESKIRFSFKECDTGNFCIRKLDTSEILKFYERLGHFETITWQQVRQMPREKGFSMEKKDDTNHKMLNGLKPHLSTFMHFRVNGVAKPFRVFAGQKDDLCCLILIDKDGKVNH